LNLFFVFYRDIGIPDHYLDRIIGKLSLQLGGDNSSLKRFGLRTLKEIGADRQDVLATILPRLMDAQVNGLGWVIWQV
jgi:hypothetical protein